MKKKFLLLSFIVSIIISLYVGVISFSMPNISNAILGNEQVKLDDEALSLKGWSLVNGEYVSDGTAYITVEGSTLVHNVRFALTVADTDNISFICEDGSDFLVSVKNDDLYVTPTNTSSCNFTLVVNEAGARLVPDSAELNPRRLNVNVVNTVLAFIIPICVLVSLVYIVSDFEDFKKDILAMKRYKYMLYDLVTKDIKTKYRRSALGVVWSVLNPLLMMLVLTAIFSNIIRVEVEGGFALFYLTGYLLFNFISEATNFALVSITSAAPLIKKVYLPKYIFPLEKCIYAFVNMLFSLIAFVIVFVVFAIMGKITPSLTMLLFPFPLITLFIFCLGICLALSALMVFFRDIGHIYGVFLTVWMYATPIIYPMNILPSWLVGIIKLNPLYYYVDYFRSVMIYGTVPPASDAIICVLYSLAVLFVGITVFRKSQDKFVLYI